MILVCIAKTATLREYLCKVRHNIVGYSQVAEVRYDIDLKGSYKCKVEVLLGFLYVK